MILPQDCGLLCLFIADSSTVVRQVHSESEAHAHAVNKSGPNVPLKITCSSTIVKHAPVANPGDGTLSPPSMLLKNCGIDEHNSFGKCGDTPTDDGGYQIDGGNPIGGGFRICHDFRPDDGFRTDGENEEDGGFIIDGCHKGTIRYINCQI